MIKRFLISTIFISSLLVSCNKETVKEEKFKFYLITVPYYNDTTNYVRYDENKGYYTSGLKVNDTFYVTCRWSPVLYDLGNVIINIDDKSIVNYASNEFVGKLLALKKGSTVISFTPSNCPNYKIDLNVEVN